MQLCWRIIDELARAVGVAVGRHYSGRLVTTLVATLFFLFPLLSTFLIEGVLKPKLYSENLDVVPEKRRHLDESGLCLPG